MDRNLVALIACQETATRALHKSLLSDLTRMPKGKAKGGRRGALTGAERRAGARQRARENIAMKEIAESCDYFREEWSASGGDACRLISVFLTR